MRSVRTTLIIASIAGGTLALAGCATNAGGTPPLTPSASVPVATSPAPVETTEPTTEPTTDPTTDPTTAPPAEGDAQGNIPASCDDVGTPEHRAATIDQLEPQPTDGGGGPEMPQGLEIALHCSWFAGDVTGAGFIVYKTDDAAASAFRAAREMHGSTCEGDDSAWTCSKTSTSDYQGNPIEQVSSYRYADGVAVESSWSNLDFQPMFDDLATAIWG